jgi:hypothetical protein
MNLYLCSQDETDGYDVFDSFICAANSVDEARNMLPDGREWGERFSTWCMDPNYVVVQLIGVADDNIGHGVVLASFNAG